MKKSPDNVPDFAAFYAGFHSPITELNCGEMCGRYNEYGAPFCCDIRHTVPAAFQREWQFLSSRTDLWRIWEGTELPEYQDLLDQVQDGQVLLACKGYQACERENRTLACRAFPFYPYLDRNGSLLGLTYYTDYRDRCWVISNLNRVSRKFINEFLETFQAVFESYPDHKFAYQEYCASVRSSAAELGEPIFLLTLDGEVKGVSPQTGAVHPIADDQLPAYGPYRIMKELPFPDENEVE